MEAKCFVSTNSSRIYHSTSPRLIPPLILAITCATSPCTHISIQHCLRHRASTQFHLRARMHDAVLVSAKTSSYVGTSKSETS